MNADQWCIWLRDSYPELVLRSSVNTVQFAFYAVKQLVAFLIAIATAVVTVVSELYSLVPVLIVTLVAFAFWFYYPELQPFLSTTGVQLLNLFFQLFQLFWNLAIILYGLFVLVWNAAAPIIGMIIYIALEIATKLLTAVVQILGQIDVYALFRPFIEILEVLTRMLTEVIQALVSAAQGLLQALSKIIGAIITIIVSVTKILFPIIKWVVGLLFRLLFPVLKVVISIVSWFLNLFNAANLNRALQELKTVDQIERAYLRVAELRDRVNALGATDAPFRRLFSFADADGEGGAFAQGYSSLHDTMYPSVNWAASRHFANERTNRATEDEIQVMLRIIDEIPIHSFSYYWFINRPVLSRIDNGAMPSDVYVGETGNTDDARAKDFTYAKFVPRAPEARALLEFGAKRKILSEEDVAVLHSAEPVGINEYWKRFDGAQANDDVIAWYSHQHYEHQHKRQAALNRLREGVRSARIDSPEEYYETFADHAAGETAQPDMSYDEFKQLQADIDESDRAAAGLPPKRQKKAHPFVDDLQARHPCKNEACGGPGHSLPHAVHTLRKLSHRRQQRMDGMSWKPESMSEEEYQKSRTIHAHVLGHATHEALDRLKWRLQDPHLHQHAKNAFTRITGHADVNELMSTFHRRYGGDPGAFIMDRIGSVSDWPAFRWLAERDDDFEARPFFGDWVRREQATDQGEGTWHHRKLNALGDSMSSHRSLLELETKEDAEYAERWREREPASDIEALHMETRAPVFARGSSEPGTSERRGSRELNGFPIPLPDIPDIYERVDEGKERQEAINSQKPHPNAQLPLFDLLTKTDCYTTTPRNPLCLPIIPSSWQITKAPFVVWPENATQDDSFCAPTFKRIPRCIDCWETYINWRWVYNAIQIPRLILSSIPVLTDTLYQLGQTYPFLRWLFKLPLGKPLGHAPSTLDYVCMAIYGPVAVLFTFLYFKALSLLWPVVTVILDTLALLFDQNVQLAARNATYWGEMQDRNDLAIRMAMKDSPNNPSLLMPNNVFGASDYAYRGMNGRTPSHMWQYGGDPSLVRDVRLSNYYPGGAVSQLRPNGPYNPTMYGANPAIYMAQNSPYQHNAAEGTNEYLGPLPGSAVPAVKDNEAAIAAAQDALVNDLRSALAHSYMELGVPKLKTPEVERVGHENVSALRQIWDWFTDDRVTQEVIAAFERSYHPLCLPFQSSILYSLQQRNQARRNWFSRHTSAPHPSTVRISHFMAPQAAAFAPAPEDVAMRELSAMRAAQPDPNNV